MHAMRPVAVLLAGGVCQQGAAFYVIVHLLTVGHMPRKTNLANDATAAPQGWDLFVLEQQLVCALQAGVKRCSGGSMRGTRDPKSSERDGTLAAELGRRELTSHTDRIHAVSAVVNQSSSNGRTQCDPTRGSESLNALHIAAYVRV